MTPIFLTTLDTGIPGTAAGNVTNTSYAAKSTGVTGNYLSAGTPTSLRITNTDVLIFGGWIKWNKGSENESVIFTKGDVLSGTEAYGVDLIASSGKLEFFADRTADHGIQSSTGLTSGTKAFVLFYLTTTSINIRINGGSVDTQAVTRSSNADQTGNVLFFQNDAATTDPFPGVLDEWFFCKNPSNLTTALTTINTDIYNGGSGIRYKDVSSGDKTTIGLVSWWGFDEGDTATRKDLHGTNDLTLTGTILQDTALVP